MNNNIIPQKYSVGRQMQAELKGHKAVIIWFTGLSGSGKSTIANVVEKALFKEGIHSYTLDGDNIRGGLNRNLGFTNEDRTENLRRIAEVAKLFLNSGTVVLSAFITPSNPDRDLIREIVGKENFLEVFVNTSFEECERRDVKGLYQKARAGEIKNFTGINAPFETPFDPDLILKTEKESIEESAKKVLALIRPKIRIANHE